MIYKFFLKIGVIVFLSCALFSFSFAMDDEKKEIPQKMQNISETTIEMFEDPKETTYLLDKEKRKKEKTTFLPQNKEEKKPKKKREVKPPLKEGEVGFWLAIKEGLSNELGRLTTTFDTSFLVFNNKDLKKQNNFFVFNKENLQQEENFVVFKREDIQPKKNLLVFNEEDIQPKENLFVFKRESLYQKEKFFVFKQ